MNLCVYASSSDALAPVFVEAAAQLGALIGKGGHTLVYGGGAVGLMGVTARAVHAAGGRVVGVIPEKLRDMDLAYDLADELVVTRSMRGRKAAMEERADAFIALPGGLGTLEEVLEIMVLRQLDYHAKPLVLLNTAGIYDGLLQLFDRLIEANFVRAQHRELWYVSSDPAGAMAYIGSYRPGAIEGKWFGAAP